MHNKPKLWIAALVVVILFFAATARAATVSQVVQGGTGVSTFSVGQCLVGNGTSPVTTGGCGFATTSTNYWLTTKSTSNLAEGSNLYYTQTRFDTALTATTTLPHITTLASLSLPYSQITGAPSAAWPFTPSTFGGVANQSTTTPFWLKNTQLIASSTIADTSTTTGNAYFASNIGVGVQAPGQAVDVVGKFRATNTLVDATNKAFYFLDINYTNAQNDFLLMFGQSKTSANTLIIGGGQTGFTAASTIALFTGPGNNTDIGTSRLSIDSTGTVTMPILSTAGVVENTALGLLYTQATSTLTPSSPLTGSLIQMGSGGSLGIQAASGSQNGYLSSADYGLLHTATTTFSAPLTYTLATNAVTCTNAANGVTGCMTAADWGLLHTATTTFSGPLSYSATTNAVTCPTCGGGNATSTEPSMAKYFVATSTLIASVFPYASSTAFSVSGTAFLTYASSTATSWTATSTGTNGINLSGGCFAVNGTCLSGGSSLSGGTTGMLTAWASATTLTATGTPTAAAYTATSTAATSTFAGDTVFSQYARAGSTACPQTNTHGLLEVCGNDNTTAGVQAGIGNKNSGANAYSFFYLNNNVAAANDSTHYGGFQYNSSNYSDTTFGTAIGVPQQLSMWATDGPLTFLAASSTTANSYINFLTHGPGTGNEVMRLTSASAVLMGTTTPGWSLLTVGTSTRPQITLSDNSGGNNWFERWIGSTLYIGTSTASATSSSPVITIDTSKNTPLITFASASTTALTVGTSFQIPNSSTQTPTVAGFLAQDTTNDQIKWGCTGGTTCVEDQRRGITYPTYATTTTWTGTSTAPAFVIPLGVTFNNVYCTVQPNGATVDAQIQYANPSTFATVFMKMIPASTTPGLYTFTSNNTPTAGATTTIAYGTPTGSPVSASCSPIYTVTGT